MAKPPADAPGTESVIKHLRDAFSQGLIISLPLLITVVVFFFVVGFVAGLLDPAVYLIEQTIGPAEDLPATVNAALALSLILLLVLLVGFGAKSGAGSGRIERTVEGAMKEVPGFGSVYTSIDEISNMLVNSDTESFREVKVIEYPFEGTYAMAFLTAGSTGVVGSAVGEEEMITVFLPMAPNPMGGFLIHVPMDRVYDVDLTVEEGVQAILSTGVTLEAKNVAEIEGEVDDESEATDEPDATDGSDATDESERADDSDVADGTA